MKRKKNFFIKILKIQFQNLKTGKIRKLKLEKCKNLNI